MTSIHHPNVFSRLTAEQQARLVEAAEHRMLPAGAAVYQQGTGLSEMSIIRSGMIRVFYVAEDGQVITFAYWQRGTLIGVPAFYRGFRHMWSAETVEPSELLTYGRSRFIQLIEEMPPLAIAVIEALEYKSKRLSTMLQLHITSSVPERLRLLLLNHMELYGKRSPEGVVIGVPFSHEQIAQLIGASRQWVSTMLARLGRAGVIRSRHRIITVLRPDHLRSAALGERLSQAQAQAAARNRTRRSAG